MMSSLPDWTSLVRLSVNGVSDSLLLDCLALRRSLEAGVKPAFPPSLVVQLKALACELPVKLGLPLPRLSIEEIRQHVIAQGLIAEISSANYGGGSAAMPFALGNIEVGSSSRSELRCQGRSGSRFVRTHLGGFHWAPMIS
jgi:hypothetical protein